jgi:hypothetical protein
VPPPTPQPTAPITNPAPRKPKPSVNFTSNDTPSALGRVNPGSMAGELNDEIPWK